MKKQKTFKTKEVKVEETLGKLLIEAPCVTIDNWSEPRMVIHNMINLKGKMILSKPQAALLYMELHKFLKL